MTFDEFNEWFSYHASCFVSMQSWLDKVTKGEGAPSTRDIKRRWLSVLQNIELADAKKASDKMLSGEEEEPNYRGSSNFSKHPAAVRRIAQRLRGDRDPARRRERFVDGERVYSCLRCRDDGVVWCWHPESMRAAKKGTLGQPFTVCSCAVRCTCREGDLNAKNLPCVFDEKMWLPVERMDLQRERQSLVDFVSAIKPPNYEPAFSDYEGKEF
jgi:hypothetical protein